MAGAEIPEIPGMNINDLMGLFNGLFGTNSTTTGTDGSPQGAAASMAFLAPLLSQFFSSDFSPEAAARDSQGSINLIMQQAMESGLVPILGGENASGGYNGTTAALLKNDLASRTAAQGAAQLAQVKSQYAGQKNAQATLIISLINALTNASRTRTSSTNNQGLLNNPNAQKAAAAAGLAEMARRAAQAASKDAGGKKPSKSPNKGPKQDTGGGQQQSDEQALNDIAREMGYGAGDKDDPNEVLTSSPTQETDQELIDRSGLNEYSDAIANRQDESSDPNYDPYDFMGNMGQDQPGEGGGQDTSGDINFDQLDPFDPVDTSGMDLPDITDLFGDNSLDNTSSDFDFTDMDFLDTTSPDFTLDDSGFDFGDFGED